jgi:hypothetical protein
MEVKFSTFAPKKIVKFRDCKPEIQTGISIFPALGFKFA